MWYAAANWKYTSLINNNISANNIGWFFPSCAWELQSITANEHKFVLPRAVGDAQQMWAITNSLYERVKRWIPSKESLRAAAARIWKAIGRRRRRRSIGNADWDVPERVPAGTPFFLFFRSFVCRNGLTYDVSAVTTGTCAARIRNEPAVHSAFIAT